MKEFEGYDNLIWLTKCQFEKPYTTPMAYSASLIVWNDRETNVSCGVKKCWGELSPINPFKMCIKLKVSSASIGWDILKFVVEEGHIKSIGLTWGSRSSSNLNQ